MKIIKGILIFIMGGIMSPFYIVGATIYHITRLIVDKKYREDDRRGYIIKEALGMYNNPNFKK